MKKGNSSKKKTKHPFTQLGVTKTGKKTIVKRPPAPPPPVADAEVIAISDSSTDAPPPPHRSQIGFSLRKSLRIHAQADPSSALSKAKKRAKDKAQGSSRAPGISLLRKFPYNRLILEQVKELFRIYNIQLGANADETAHIIHRIQQQDRTSFEEIVLDLLDKSKKLDSSSPVILDTSSLPHVDNSSLTHVDAFVNTDLGSSNDDAEIFHDSISQT